ncbi:transcriptional regulator with XRE-family HTH domain [Ruminiclostridium sufflavum DSM 19573]|uniref:Transcriptional regulator with XRE-family HTH domain n=1 Tax=Ruminiclostridium sufflavum DSM 19573 TaxID=1121337 RepID=A0A318XUA5_9FIRM|nr:helix-turn-helix transcriptional regulator [Ruminiclostridium sufflavum]PYG86527.1 transcriptional regulator with XRE-family HTH domain [Ruminiclostridium sufflavum DSM 19573]
MSVLSERIKTLRKAKKQSQNEVGKALGKSRETISKYELGEREPDPGVIVLLSKYFDVSSDYMLGITNNSENLPNNENDLFSPEMYAFETYLKNENFIPYVKLAVLMNASNIEANRFEALISDFIEQNNRQKHL